jgi:hypothetical protein
VVEVDLRARHAVALELPVGLLLELRPRGVDRVRDGLLVRVSRAGRDEQEDRPGVAVHEVADRRAERREGGGELERRDALEPEPAHVLEHVDGARPAVAQ